MIRWHAASGGIFPIVAMSVLLTRGTDIARADPPPGAIACDSGAGYVSGYGEPQLGLATIKYSEWSSFFTGSYRARRKDSAGNITYEYNVSAGESGHELVTERNYRRTTFKNNGGSNVYWSMAEWTWNGGC